MELKRIQDRLAALDSMKESLQQVDQTLLLVSHPHVAFQLVAPAGCRTSPLDLLFRSFMTSFHDSLLWALLSRTYDYPLKLMEIINHELAHGPSFVRFSCSTISMHSCHAPFCLAVSVRREVLLIFHLPCPFPSFFLLVLQSTVVFSRVSSACIALKNAVFQSSPGPRTCFAIAVYCSKPLALVMH